MKMLVVLLIAAVALAMIVRDMLRESRGETQRRFVWLRAAPFAICTSLSVWIALRAPNGRKPFSFDWSVAAEDLMRSATKVPHLVGVAVLVLLAVVAFGTRRLRRAFLTTMLVSASWELCQTTVVGHHARIADLGPNLVGALTAIGIVAAVRSYISQRDLRRHLLL